MMPCVALSRFFFQIKFLDTDFTEDTDVQISSVLFENHNMMSRRHNMTSLLQNDKSV